MKRGLVVSLLLLACEPQRVELLHSPVGCEDFELVLPHAFARVALSDAVAFGISDGTLRSFVVGDGGVSATELSSSASSSAFSAARRGAEVALAFHQNGVPSLARVSRETGAFSVAPRSVLSTPQGANAPWGAGVSVGGETTLVAYRTLSSEAAFTTVDAADAQHFAVVRVASLGEVDATLDGARVKLVYSTGGQVEEQLVDLDGARLETRTLADSGGLLGRPIACPAVSVYPRGMEDGGVRVEADGVFVASVSSRVVRGVCAGEETFAAFVRGGRLELYRFARGGEFSEVLSLPTPTLNDAAIATDAQSVWLLLAPRFEPARLYRRCLR